MNFPTRNILTVNLRKASIRIYLRDVHKFSISTQSLLIQKILRIYTRHQTSITGCFSRASHVLVRYKYISHSKPIIPSHKPLNENIISNEIFMSQNYKSTGCNSHLYFICFWHNTIRKQTSPNPNYIFPIFLSRFLSVVRHPLAVPRTELIGDPDRYVKAGSTVIFRCVVRGALEQPSYIIWYHGSQQVYVENRRGWKVQFERDVDGDTHSSVSWRLHAH